MTNEQLREEWFEEESSNDTPVLKILVGNGPFAYRHADMNDICSLLSQAKKEAVEEREYKIIDKIKYHFNGFGGRLFFTEEQLISLIRSHSKDEIINKDK